MFEDATILVVDDDNFMRKLFVKTLGDAFKVVAVPSGKGCLAWLETQRADLILLDIKMPGLDGYETCQCLKALYPDAPPVIFISAGDDVNDRMRGYDAGGDDYLVKPFEPRELLAKVSAMLHAAENRHRLKQQAEYASSTAMTAVTSMGEMGILLQSLQRFNGCRELFSLAAAVAVGLTEFGLEGVVRVRTPADEAIYSTRCEVMPLELSAIDKVAGMGRIVEFGSRMSVSYENVTLLVNNCPAQDDERRGRLRDHLAVLAEGAQGRAAAIQRDLAISKAVVQATAALVKLDISQRETRAGTSMAIQDMTADLEKAYVSVALSERQEDHMAGIVGRGVDRIREFVSADFDLQHHLTGLIHGLQQASLAAA